jgi:hypothetical protein
MWWLTKWQLYLRRRPGFIPREQSMWNLWGITFSASTSVFRLNFSFHHYFLLIHLSSAEWEMGQLDFIGPQIPPDYENGRKKYCLGNVHLRPACQVWVQFCNLKMAVDLNKYPLLYWNSNPRSIEVRPNAQLTFFTDLRFHGNEYEEFCRLGRCDALQSAL